MRAPTDYRPHSYSFANNAISAVFVVALVVLVIAGVPWPGSVRPGFTLAMSGITLFCCVGAWASGFAALRYLDRFYNEIDRSIADRDLCLSDRMMFLGVYWFSTSAATLVLAIASLVLRW